MKRTIAILLAALLLLATSCTSTDNTDKKGEKDVPSGSAIEFWAEDSPAMKSITAFVDEVCDKSSDSYVPPEERIAVFDSDGTLYGELFPTYFDQCLMMYRLLHDDTYEAAAEDKEFAQALEKAFLTGQPEPKSPRSTGQITTESFKGFTVEEYRAYIRDFMSQPAMGFEGMTYGQGSFKPMVALIRYLTEHDFMVYIVSGAETNLLRELWKDDLGAYIPPYRVIGSTISLVATGQGDKAPRDYNLTAEDKVIIGGDMTYKSLKMGKVANIINQIGLPPTLAFGNSSGDFAMAEYALQHGGKGYMVLCDDTERDYGNTEKAAKFKEDCQKWGFETVSMKDEFTTIYGENVKKTQIVQDEALQPAA